MPVRSTTGSPEIPQPFSRRIAEQFTAEHDLFLASLDQEPAVSVRVHPQKQAKVQPCFFSDTPSDPKIIRMLHPANETRGVKAGLMKSETAIHSAPAGLMKNETAIHSAPAGLMKSETSFLPAPAKQKIPWAVHGWYLTHRPSFTNDPLFHAGCYYVQEASSMVLERVLQLPEIQQQAHVILDACAAPGGKTTLMASMFPESLIVANEVIRSRLGPLLENTKKWGTGNIAVTSSETSRIACLQGFFDLALLDAPCSGEGLFRKDPSSRSLWNAELHQHCSLRQRSLMLDVWKALRAGGVMLYTTCTYHPEENEHNVAWLLQQTGGTCLRLPASEWCSSIREICQGPVTGYGFYPHRTAGEGFFLSVIRKPEVLKFSRPGKAGFKETSSKEKNARLANVRGAKYGGVALPAAEESIMREVNTWFNDTEEMGGFMNGDNLHRIPLLHLPLLEQVRQSLSVRYAGTRTARVNPSTARSTRKFGAGKTSKDASRVVKTRLFSTGVENKRRFKSVQENHRINATELRPDPAAALSAYLNASHFPLYELSREEALSYLRRENPSVPSDATSGWYLASFHGQPLGWLKNIGTRMNNYYPREWRLRK